MLLIWLIRMYVLSECYSGRAGITGKVKTNTPYRKYVRSRTQTRFMDVDGVLGVVFKSLMYLDLHIFLLRGKGRISQEK